MTDRELLRLNDVWIQYRTIDDDVKAVNGVSLSLNKGESLGLVGETGAGKTTTALAILGLLQKGVGEVTQGEIVFKGENLLKKTEREMRGIRGKEISMIFQDPMTSLNPVFSVGDQIGEVLELHGVKGSAKEARVEEILELVGIEANRKTSYPHQFSGGMKQRIVIAMALACEPDLLIADEPTTALDVTIQAQVMAMIDEIQKKLGTAMILITHDLGIVAEACDKVAIMYAGEIVEFGTLEEVFDRNLPHHPYTVGLFGSIPSIDIAQRRLAPINGMTPDPTDLPQGCYFSPRCQKCMEICKQEHPTETVFEGGRMLKCHLFHDSNEGETLK